MNLVTPRLRRASRVASLLRRRFQGRGQVPRQRDRWGCPHMTRALLSPPLWGANHREAAAEGGAPGPPTAPPSLRSSGTYPHGGRRFEGLVRTGRGDWRGARSLVGARRFELPTSASRTLRSSQAELRPDRGVDDTKIPPPGGDGSVILLADSARINLFPARASRGVGSPSSGAPRRVDEETRIRFGRVPPARVKGWG